MLERLRMMGKQEDTSDMYKIIYCLRHRTLLLIIDNIEDPLRDPEQDLIFREILEELLSKCDNLKICTTTRKELVKIGNIEEYGYHMTALSP